MNIIKDNLVITECKKCGGYGLITVLSGIPPRYETCDYCSGVGLIRILLEDIPLVKIEKIPSGQHKKT